MHPCTIREWRESDAPALAAAINNPRVHDNLRDGIPFPYTVDDALDFIRAMLARDRTQQFAFAVALDDGRAIGSIGVTRGQNIHFRTAELGYYIAEPYWGQGFATCAVRQVCDHVFAHSDILRIFAEPFADNAASCRVLEKAGFAPEGILRQNAVKNGRIRDMKLYSRIKSERIPDGNEHH